MQTVPLKDPQTCAEFKATIPSDYFQREIKVPLNWAVAAGDQLNIFYYGYIPSKTERVVLFINGGVGRSSWGLNKYLENLKNRPGTAFVLFDRRGAGCSSPIPEMKTASDFKSLNFFTGRSMAQDVQAIRNDLWQRHELGPDVKWAVVGHSFGGEIAEWYLSLFPETAQNVHIVSSFMTNDPLDFERIRAAGLKRDEDLFISKHPDVPKLMQSLRSQIPKDTCFEKNGMKLCGPVILDALAIRLSMGQNSWDSLYKIITGLADSSGKLIQERLPDFVDEHFFKMYGNNPFLSAAVEKADQTPGYNAHQSGLIVFNELKHKGLKPDQWVFSELRLNLAITYSFQKELDRLKPKPVFSNENTARVLNQYPDLHFFRHLGEEDSIMPLELFKKQKDLLKGKYRLFTYLGVGHQVYRELSFWNNVLDSVH